MHPTPSDLIGFNKSVNLGWRMQTDDVALSWGFTDDVLYCPVQKERLKKSDYFLLMALPSLLAASALLQSILNDLYAHGLSDSTSSASSPKTSLRVTSRLTTAMDLLWLTVYCVKASFLAQFKFYKPLYSYVSPGLTRYYWTSLGICVISFLVTLVVPIVLCPNSRQCRYMTPQDTVAWEITLSMLDIITDLLVISIPLSLARLANFRPSNAIINASFKSLSVFMMVTTACRIIFQFDENGGQINYRSLTLWLAVEAAVAVVMGSVSSNRAIALYLQATRKRRDHSKQWEHGYLWVH